jgi:hypothetical protein
METIEEAAKKYAEDEIKNRGSKNDKLICMIDFSAGANWMADRMYSEDELRNAVEISVGIALGASRFIINEESFEKLKKQIK